MARLYRHLTNLRSAHTSLASASSPNSLNLASASSPNSLNLASADPCCFNIESWQLLLSSTQGRLAFVSSSVIFISLSPSTLYRLVSHWDYLMYGPALHTVITCATAPHSCNAQGCIRSATTQLSNVICGTDSRCRGRQCPPTAALSFYYFSNPPIPLVVSPVCVALYRCVLCGIFRGA